jgi:hypothetical protein
LGETENGNGCLTSGRSLGSLGTASGGLDDRHDGYGSPARSSSKGRARERASLREMGWWSDVLAVLKRELAAWAGDVVGDLGVRACMLVHGG